MAAVYEEIVLAWKGEEYTVQPSFRMAQRIEAGGISIAGVTYRISEGQPPTTQIATILAHMLTSGGAKGATPVRVYEHLAAHADTEEWMRIHTAISMAFIPREPDQGNSGGPADGAETKAETSTETPSST